MAKKQVFNLFPKVDLKAWRARNFAEYMRLRTEYNYVSLQFDRAPTWSWMRTHWEARRNLLARKMEAVGDSLASSLFSMDAKVPVPATIRREKWQPFT